MGTRPWKRSNNKRLRHGQPHHERPKQSDSPQNEATLGTWTSKPDVLHPNEDNGSESGDVNHQTINNEASQQIQRDGQCTCQPENGLSRQWMEVSNTEAATTEIVTKVLEEKGDAIGLSAPLTFTTFPPAEIPRDAGIREAILPIDKDWVMVDDAVSLGAPLLGPTSCGAGAGEPQSRFSLLHIMECALAGSPTRCPDPIAQAHRAQHPSLSKHVGSGGTHPGGTDQREEVGAYTAHNTPTDVLEYRNLRKPNGRDPVVNHPQHVASNSSNVPRVIDEIATRPKNAYEPRFSSLHSIGNIPQQQPRYSDKPQAESDSCLPRTRLLFPREWFPSEE